MLPPAIKLSPRPPAFMASEASHVVPLAAACQFRDSGARHGHGLRTFDADRPDLDSLKNRGFGKRGRGAPERAALGPVSSLLRRFAQGLAALALASCAGPGQFYAHGYLWEPTGETFKCYSVLWTKADWYTMRQYCGPEHLNQHIDACAYPKWCEVFSYYSEEEAKQINRWGISLYEHEVIWHINRHLRHPT